MVLGLEYQILLTLVTHGKELLFENRFSLFWYHAEVSVKNTGAGVKLLTCPYPLKIQACPLLDQSPDFRSRISSLKNTGEAENS